MKNIRSLLSEGLWNNNPINKMALGLCSALAVTNFIDNTLIMSLSVTITLLLNSFLISALRKLIPEQIRMITYMIVISTVVILIDIILKIYIPVASKELGPYVPLIITNCIIMGRAEAFAIKNSIIPSLIDAFAMGLGYSWTLTTIAIFRELLGSESFLSIGIFSIPPGAFFMLGFLILITNKIRKKGTQNG